MLAPGDPLPHVSYPRTKRATHERRFMFPIRTPSWYEPTSATNIVVRGGVVIQVPGVPLISQTRTWACWYACAQMLIQWKRERGKATLAEHPNPSEVPQLERLHAANPGLSYGQVLTLAQLLGLRTIPPMSLTVQGVKTFCNIMGRCGRTDRCMSWCLPEPIPSATESSYTTLRHSM
jgi:Papain-like cysteine protease AvrRpt2